MGWGDWSWLPQGNGASPQWRQWRVCLEYRRSLRVSQDEDALWRRSIANYNNHEGLLMAQNLQERSGSHHQGKNQDQLRCLLKAKGRQKWKQVVTSTSYNHMASNRNQDYCCLKCFLLVLLLICLYAGLYINIEQIHFSSFSFPLSCNIRLPDFVL